MNYVLKRKDDIITIVDFADDGSVHKFYPQLVNPELAPLHDPKDTNWLRKWWKQRAVPIEQGYIKHMLEEKGLIGPEDFLLKNLGLSLTDYYWISPVDSGMTWRDVNLFENDFRGDILIAEADEKEDYIIPHYTPNGSLQGTLEKSWMIIDGERGLLKGNRDFLSAESINEVIATKLHELQGFDNYTEYRLIGIHGRDYEYGCYSKLFTSQQLELVSAYEIVCSEKKSNEISTYEHLINVCQMHGLEEDCLRSYMDYMIMADFVLSGRDRHLRNVSVLRDASTLQFIKPAPIYDSGKCLFVHESVPFNTKGLLNIQTTSFFSDELRLLKQVQDKRLLDVTKLPSRTYVEEMYQKDTHMDSERIALIGEAYEKKIDLFRAFQLGEDLYKIKIGMCNH